MNEVNEHEDNAIEVILRGQVLVVVGREGGVERRSSEGRLFAR